MQTDKQSADSYTRQSFTLRRMKRWQIRALAIAAVVLIVAGLVVVY